MVNGKAPREDRQQAASEEGAAMARLADASAKLFAEQAAAFAAITALSISAAGQWASLFLQGREAATTGKAPGSATEPTRAERRDNVVSLVPKVAETPVAPVPVGEKAVAAEAKTVKPSRQAAQAKSPELTPAPTKKTEAKVAAPKASKPKTPAKDDLKRISGIGPRLVSALNERGVFRFADLVALDAAALAALDGELGLEGRIVRDDWVGQARSLMGSRR